MMTSEFASKLRKLNSRLWVNFNAKLGMIHKDFPATNIFYDGKHITGINLFNIPEQSWVGIDLDALELAGYKGLPNDKDLPFLDNDFIEYIRKYDAKNLKERFVARGYRFLLSTLCNMGYISQEKAEREFNCILEPNRPDMAFPRRYVGLRGLEG